MKDARGSLPKQSPSDTAINADDDDLLGLLKAGPTASLTLHFFIAYLEQTFAFAILAFRFLFARVLLHVFSSPFLKDYLAPSVALPKQVPILR